MNVLLIGLVVLGTLGAVLVGLMAALLSDMRRTKKETEES
jgi:multisubunit Na+/H+ antiporter MnhB subunit